jgi:hypothetical protein
VRTGGAETIGKLAQKIWRAGRSGAPGISSRAPECLEGGYAARRVA